MTRMDLCSILKDAEVISMEKVKLSYSTIVFSVLFVLAIILFYHARYIILISFIGIGVGVLIVPILRTFHDKFHLPRPISVAIVFIGILLFFSGVLSALYYLLSDQISSLSQRWPEIVTQVERWIFGVFDRHPWIKEQVTNFELGSYLRNSVMKIFKGFQVGILLLGWLVFIFALGLYSASGGDHYYRSLVEAFPLHRRPKASMALKESAHVLRGWFYAQLIDMAIIGSLTGIGMWLIGIEYWAVFGLLSAVMGIIPYLGIFIVVLTASLITLASDPEKLPLMLLVFLIVEQLEGNVILPLVLRGKAELPVVPLLIFMMTMGTYLGILGVFIAPPVFAILRTLYIELYLPYVNQPKYPVEE